MLELDAPHRWINAGQEAFGRWLLDIREPLLRGARIDLGTAPANVRWLELPEEAGERGAARSAAVLAGAAALPNGARLMVIGEATRAIC